MRADALTGSRLAELAGRYIELVHWRDSSGRSGEMKGGIELRVEDDRVSLSMDDGHIMVGRLPADAAEPVPLAGTGGEATSSGSLYVGREAMILEYLANVRGREERTVDVWTVSDGVVTRAGLIRQHEVTIWFEARMQKC